MITLKGDKEKEATTLYRVYQIYNEQGDFLQALNYLKQSLEIYKFLNDTFRICGTLFNIGEIYFSIDNMPEALNTWMEVHSLATEVEDLDALNALDRLVQQLEFENFDVLKQKIL